MTSDPLRRQGRTGITDRTLLLLCLLGTTIIFSSWIKCSPPRPAVSPLQSPEELTQITRLYLPPTTQVICAERTNNLDVMVSASLDMSTEQLPRMLRDSSWPRLQWSHNPTEAAERGAELATGYAARCSSLIGRPEKYGFYIDSGRFLHLVLQKPKGMRVRMYLIWGIF